MNFVEEREIPRCTCGGEVTIYGGTYGHPTFAVKCKKCGGEWLKDCSSPLEALTCWEIRSKEHL